MKTVIKTTQRRIVYVDLNWLRNNARSYTINHITGDYTIRWI